VKPDVDTPSTVPEDPPAAGPDRAFDPTPPDPRLPAAPRPGPACPDVAEEDAVVADGDDEAKPTETPITAHTSTAQAATIHRPFLFDSNRRSHGRRACPATIPGADESGEDAGGGRVPAGFAGSYSFMMALLLLGSYASCLGGYAESASHLCEVRLGGL
jgi:hypothetical protein